MQMPRVDGPRHGDQWLHVTADPALPEATAQARMAPEPVWTSEGTGHWPAERRKHRTDRGSTSEPFSANRVPSCAPRA